MPPADRGPLPVVWVVASHRALFNEHHRPQPYTLVDEGGLRALLALGLQPVSYPSVPDDRLGALLDGVHGVLMGGSATNVDPARYGACPTVDGEPDREREAVSLPLARMCVARGVPLITFCRGTHEFNVAFGGTLHQSLQALDRGVAHWEDPGETLAQQYEDRHAVNAVPGGALAQLAGAERFAVNSLHSQGVDALGEGLVAEGFADDGLVEALRWHDARTFAWGFQFHPEWQHEARAPYGRIMRAFAAACRARCEAMTANAC